jgi:competence protein ComEC
MTLAPAAAPPPPSRLLRRPLVPLTLAFLGGIVAAERWTPPAALTAVAAVGLGAAAAGCLWRRRSRPAWAAILGVFGLLGFLHWDLSQRAPAHSIARLPEAVLAGPVVVDGIVAAPPEPLPPAGPRGGPRLRFALDVTAVRGPDGWVQAAGRARLTVYEPHGRVRYGDRVRGPVHLRRPRGYRNPGAFDPARYLRAQGIALEGWVATDAVLELIPQQGGLPILAAVYALREHLLEVIDRAFPAPTAGLVKAMLLGDRSDIPEAANDAFLQSGTYHILAISGLNVSVLAGALYFFLKLLRVPIRGRAAVCLMVVTGYAALAGGGASVVRAAVMADVFFLAALLDREADLLNALAIAALGLTVWNPPVVQDVGFLLTFAATLGIVVVVERLLTPAVDPWADPRPAAPPAGGPPAPATPTGARRAVAAAGRWILEAVAVTLAATAATLPILAVYFNRVSLVGLVANLPIVPLSSALTATGTAAAAFLAVVPGGLPPLNWVNEVIVAWLLRLAGWFAAVPYASVHLPTPTLPMVLCYYVGMAGLVAWRYGGPWRRAGRRAAAGAAAGLVLLVAARLAPAHRPDGFRATVLDVGQGDGIVVELPGRRVMVVDAGGMWDHAFDVGDRVVAPYLRWRWIGRIDVLVITHPHPDHANGARALLRDFRVGEVWEPGVPSGLPAAGWVAEWTSQHGIPRHTVRSGFPSRRWGDVEVEALHPPPGGLLWGSPRGPASDTNSNSIVLRLRVNGRSLLLAGDLEAEGEAVLLAARRPLDAEVLKVPHHGGRTSSTPGFLGRVGPKVAIVSAGYRNRFRHPHPETLARYREIGARIFRTDLHGAVTVEMGADGVVVRPFVGEPLAVSPGTAPAPGETGYPQDGAPGPDADVSPPDLP